MFQPKIGEQSAQLLLDTRTIDRSFITASTGKRLGIPIWILPSIQTMEQGPWTTSVGVDPTEFLAPPLEGPNPPGEIDIPSHMMTPIITVMGYRCPLMVLL